MATIVTRSGKGSPLTNNEVDANFTNLNSDKVETSAISTFGGTLIDDADAATARTTLGLGSAATSAATDFVAQTSTTGSAEIPTGTEAQRDGAPSAGYFRFNTDSSSFEGYDGTAWGAIGGSVDFSAVDQDVLPDADSTRDIGSTSKRWAQGWFDDVTLTNLNGNPIATAGSLSNRNKIINGAMRIDQRNAGAAVTPTSATYTLDRWNTNLTQASKFSVQQNAGSVTPPAGFSNYLGVTSLSAYSVLSGDFFSIIQSVEGFNSADLGWGSANAQPVTLSFWVRSSLTGTFGGSLNNSGFTRAYPFAYTISSANTWEYKTVTVTGDTAGTWLTNNGVGVRVYFNLGAGATYSGTAGAWASGAILAPTGATSVVGTNGATFYITGVQLEVGDTATPFEHRSYGQELALCLRYFNTSQFYVTTAGAPVQTFYPVEMRASPTITGGGAGFANTGGTLAPKRLICSQTLAADQTLTFSAEL